MAGTKVSRTWSTVLARAAVAGVALAAAAISFRATTEVAITEHAVTPSMAWLVPICIELSVLAFGLIAITKRRRQAPARVEEAAAGALLLLATVVNIAHAAHAGAGVLGWILASVSPVLLAIGGRSLLGEIHHAEDRRAAEIEAVTMAHQAAEQAQVEAAEAVRKAAERTQAVAQRAADRAVNRAAQTAAESKSDAVASGSQGRVDTPPAGSQSRLSVVQTPAQNGADESVNVLAQIDSLADRLGAETLTASVLMPHLGVSRATAGRRLAEWKRRQSIAS